mmetsp:Transcript_15756/g.20558  ORF Transcript_15756/g.20558 Transcript_15756/m.20558 type:complete len:308 (+) Transcript_15756:111-1034(+)
MVVVKLKKYENIPFVLQCWKNIADSLPEINLPIGPEGKPLSVSFSLFTALFLSILNIIAGHVLVNVVGFPEGEIITKETTASVVGEFHSNNLLVGLAFLFATHSYQPSQKMSVAPLWWQKVCDSVISFCIGYMIYDFIFIIATNYETGLNADNYVFLGHHVATTIYMMQTRMYGAGHFSAMIAMFLGEMTNPFHNGHYILQNALSLDCCNTITWVQNLDYINTFIFSLMYVIIRSFLGPVYFLHASIDLAMNGRKNGIPVWVICIWIALIWAVVHGSVPWVQKCWGMLMEYFPGTDAQQQESVQAEM